MRIWMIIGTIFAIGAGMIFILKFLPKKCRDFVIGKTNTMPFFYMISISLGGGLNSNAVPMRNFARTLLLIWMLSCLVLRNAYFGKLFHFIRSNQRMEPLVDLDQLYDSDFELYVFERFHSLMINILPDQEHRMIVWRMDTRAFHNLTDVNFHGAYMAIVQALDYFNFINFPNINVLKTKQDILMTPMCMYHGRHSSLVRPFDEQIGLYKANGLNEKWISIYKTPTFHQNDNIGPKQLSFDQISGVFIVCSMLLGVSIIFFILELASNWCTPIKKFLNFLTQ